MNTLEFVLFNLLQLQKSPKQYLLISVFSQNKFSSNFRKFYIYQNKYLVKVHFCVGVSQKCKNQCCRNFLHQSRFLSRFLCGCIVILVLSGDFTKSEINISSFALSLILQTLCLEHAINYITLVFQKYVDNMSKIFFLYYYWICSQ